MRRQLILADGTVFVGEGFGSEETSIGEVVFHTGMTGYQEILTDPSFAGQIVTFTYPLIGNYGVNHEDFETFQPAVKGLIVKEACDYPSNFRSQFTIDDYCKSKKIPGISGVDTRKLTRIIRRYGTLKGALCGMEVDVAKVIEQLQNQPISTELVETVSTKQLYPSPGRGHRVVLIDYGMKHGILRELKNRKCTVIVAPHTTTAEEVLNLHPDGVMLSNGPGDPKDIPVAIQTVKELIGKVPIFGICLGHQLLALACGANTSKLKFGHRGANHPVKDLATGKVVLTSQNHGYAVEHESVRNTPLFVTHIAINDGTVEGLKHKEHLAFSVQYHPESSPGPEDANYLFDQFIEMMNTNQEGAYINETH
ncbi:carbamoyl phosphate synthase small subunit [Perspicuibacillus lycopersici]|nr:carbamoyl phosphate synthase small subunit [Perspicuibacillus lycopersici]